VEQRARGVKEADKAATAARREAQMVSSGRSGDVRVTFHITSHQWQAHAPAVAVVVVGVCGTDGKCLTMRYEPQKFVYHTCCEF
jgi:hypothetical protein